MREYDYSLVGIWKSGKEVVSVSLVKEGIFVGRQLLFFFSISGMEIAKKHILFFAYETYHDDILMTCMGKTQKFECRGEFIYVINVYFDEMMHNEAKIANCVHKPALRWQLLLV